MLYQILNQQWGTADAESKVPSVENPELTDVLPSKPGVGQNTAVYASPIRNFFLVLISTLPVHPPSSSFFVIFFFFKSTASFLKLCCIV